jgi:hypothetical protein
MKTLRPLVIGLTLLFVLTHFAAAGSGNWKNALQERLKSEYPITKVGLRGLAFDYNRVTEEGGSFVVRMPGIYADLAGTKQAILKTTIKEGQAQQQRGIAAGLTDTRQSRQLKVGEAVYVSGIAVKDDAIEFDLLTVDIVNFDGIQTRYRSKVVFPFESGSLSTLSLEEVKKAIDPAFAAAAVANAVQSKTIRLGMSVDEVKKTLGNPGKIVDLGPKQIYVYPDMKVVFQDSKVSDVQ